MNKFTKQYLLLVALLIVVTFMPACSSVEVVTEDDRIEQLIKTIPDDVKLSFVDKSYFKGLLAGNNGYYNQYTKTIHSVYDSCVLEHEIYHARYGLGHDHFPQRLMRCGA
jgi:hypothetical protein